MKECMKRVYFVGAHSSGKTTLANWVSQRYGLPLIPEAARIVLNEMGTTLERLRLSPELADRFQLEIWRRQLCLERAERRFVADRAFDHLCYAAEHSSAACEVWEDAQFHPYMLSLSTCRSSVVFFVRPQLDLIKADGVRSDLSWECVQRIDAMCKLLLKIYRVPFIELASAEMDSRVSTIRAVLGNGETQC